MSLTLQLIAVCVVVGTTFAAEHPCCISKKFFAKGLIVTATLKSGSSIPTMSQNAFAVDQDYDRKLQAVNGTVTTENEHGEFVNYYQVIRDFHNMKTYNFNGTHCHIYPIVGEELPDGCVPKTLAHSGTYTMGSGDQTMHINGWYGKVGNETLTYATTVNDCTLVSFTRFGTLPDGTKITESAQFVDVVQYTNSYDSVFNIPNYCNTGGMAVGK
ncbi:uncharacterized protein LOC123529708 [Mercenaria mercenaria]|uniref:uncharacterized protein LOC123529708 n=1 Tax=Mercenaria mercenaria TaxID=6596 RepID=UPI00234E4EC9|nr:uncharacterized protein LOC123529708 [Mercenaria mercenaria]